MDFQLLTLCNRSRNNAHNASLVGPIPLEKRERGRYHGRENLIIVIGGNSPFESQEHFFRNMSAFWPTAAAERTYLGRFQSASLLQRADSESAHKSGYSC